MNQTAGQLSWLERWTHKPKVAGSTPAPATILIEIVIKEYLKKIFRNITNGFFFKIYGTIENSIKSSKDNRIKVKTINVEKQLGYNVFIIPGGRLYTDRIQDTAVILDNKIIEGPSFQLRKGSDAQIFNSNIKDNIVFTTSTERLYQCQK